MLPNNTTKTSSTAQKRVQKFQFICKNKDHMLPNNIISQYLLQ